MSAPTLAEVLSPYLADMRIKAGHLFVRPFDPFTVAKWIEGWELAISVALVAPHLMAPNGTSTPLTPATPEPTEPERVNTLGGSPQEQGSLDAGACELCTPMDGDCLNAGCNRAAPDTTAALLDRANAWVRAERTYRNDDGIDIDLVKSLGASLREERAECERLQQRVRELEVMRSTVRPRIERLLAQCGFATPMILRILDPVFGDGPADHGADFAARKHPDCVAVMCGKVDCRSSGPCYTLVHPRAEEKGTDA